MLFNIILTLNQHFELGGFIGIWEWFGNIFQVRYHHMFEPYVVFNKNQAPDFDISFILRDKVSFLYNLNCVG